MAEENLIAEQDQDYIDNLPSVNEDDDYKVYVEKPPVLQINEQTKREDLIDESDKEYINNLGTNPDVFPKEIPDNNTQSVERNEPNKNLSLLDDRETRKDRRDSPKNTLNVADALMGVYKDVAPKIGSKESRREHTAYQDVLIEAARPHLENGKIGNQVPILYFLKYSFFQYKYQNERLYLFHIFLIFFREKLFY